MQYPLIPDSLVEVRTEYNILQSGGGAILDVRRAKSGTGQPRRVFTLIHNHISLQEWMLLTDFFNARKGMLESFDFVDPSTQQTLKVRFDQDTLRAEKPLGREINPRFVVQVTLREVLKE